MTFLFTPPRVPPGPIRSVLAFDPGLACGWALLAVQADQSTQVDRLASGAFELPRGRHEGAPYRQLRRWVVGMLDRYLPTVVAVEHVAAHKGTRAAHVYGGIRSHIAELCARRDLVLLPVPVGTVKKRATGKGNAKKDAVFVAARRAFGDRIETTDEADALFVGVCALDETAAMAVEEGA